MRQSSKQPSRQSSKNTTRIAIVIVLALAAFVIVIAQQVIPKNHSTDFEQKDWPVPSLPRSTVQSIEQEFESATKEQNLKIVKSALFAIQPQHLDEEGRKAILVLELGLLAQDAEIRETAAATVQSILIDIAHGTTALSSDSTKDLHRLFKVYKREASAQIARTREANPASPTLTYLEKI